MAGKGLHLGEQEPKQGFAAERGENLLDMACGLVGFVDIGFGQRGRNDGEMGPGGGDGQRPFVASCHIDEDGIRRGSFREFLQMGGDLLRVRGRNRDGAGACRTVAKPARDGAVIVEIDDMDGFALMGEGAGEAGDGGQTCRRRLSRRRK